jgi:hypothetical protein
MDRTCERYYFASNKLKWVYTGVLKCVAWFLSQHTEKVRGEMANLLHCITRIMSREEQRNRHTCAVCTCTLGQTNLFEIGFQDGNRGPRENRHKVSRASLYFALPQTMSNLSTSLLHIHVFESDDVSSHKESMTTFFADLARYSAALDDKDKRRLWTEGRALMSPCESRPRMMAEKTLIKTKHDSGTQQASLQIYCAPALINLLYLV